jgi:hypothetical protein
MIILTRKVPDSWATLRTWAFAPGRENRPAQHRISYDRYTASDRRPLREFQVCLFRLKEKYP